MKTALLLVVVSTIFLLAITYLDWFQIPEEPRALVSTVHHSL